MSDGQQPTPSDAPVPPATRQDGRKGTFKGMGAAYIMVSSVLLGVGIGYLIDALRGTRPFWTITVFAAFFVAGTYHMIKEGSK